MRYRKQSLLEELLDDVVDATRLGRSVLVQAAARGHSDLLLKLLHRISGDDPTDGTDFPQLRQTISAACLEATEQGYPDCLLTLLGSYSTTLDTGDIHKARNERGQTALILAASNGDTECIRQLLLHDPETQVAASDEGGQTALIAAANIPWIDVANRDHADCVSLLLQHSPDAQVAAANSDGVTALMQASGHGHAECVGQLLQHSPEAQVAAANRDGVTALMQAACNGRAECVSQLLQHSPEAQVAAADVFGNTALIQAADRGQAACTRQLLQHSPGDQVAAANKDGDTALMAAADRGHAECVSELLQHSPEAQIAATTAEGDTALTAAARHGHVRCLDLLLQHSLQQQKVDGALLAALRGWDADLASPSPHRQCLERLLVEGAQLPAEATAAEREKQRLLSGDLASRALVADGANEAAVGPALAASKKRKADEVE